MAEQFLQQRTVNKMSEESKDSNGRYLDISSRNKWGTETKTPGQERFLEHTLKLIADAGLELCDTENEDHGVRLLYPGFVIFVEARVRCFCLLEEMVIYTTLKLEFDDECTKEQHDIAVKALAGWDLAVEDVGGFDWDEDIDNDFY